MYYIMYKSSIGKITTASKMQFLVYDPPKMELRRQKYGFRIIMQQNFDQIQTQKQGQKIVLKM